MIETANLTDARPGTCLQRLKDVVMQAGKDLTGNTWDDIFGEDGNGVLTEEDPAGEEKESPESGGAAGEDGGGSVEEANGNLAGDPGDMERENAAGSEQNADSADPSDPDGIAAVSYAGKEDLTAETAATVEDFQEITVLITNKGEGGYWHSTLSFTFTADVVLTTGDGRTYLKAGDTLKMGAENFTAGDSFVLEKAADDTEDVLTDDIADPDGVADLDGMTDPDGISDNAAVFRIDFSAEAGSSDTRTYAGILEITVTEDGFLLRNTLPLEEYLRYVVPAEMPASYPEEALKAQAICARTYALSLTVGGAYAEYGADISDDTSCQVYNTQGTDEKTDAAVLATAGEYLVFDGEPAECYYFSTSCGVTTDAAIWGEEIAYLRSVLVSSVSGKESVSANSENSGEDKAATGENTEGGSETGTAEISEKDITSEIGELLKNEEYLQNFLEDRTLGAESGEPWYRWEATFSVKTLAARLEGATGEILAIEVTQRGSGGVAVELTVYGSKGQKVIESQYAIREFFCLSDGASCIRQDGTKVSGSMLLPSAFFYLQMGTDGAVTLVGGGFGHGCGMSQNAAKAYAEAGADAHEILSFFYNGTKIYRAENS